MVQRKRASLERRDRRIGIWFLVPTFVVLLVIVAYPTFYTMLMSLFRWRPTELATPFVGLKNFAAVFADDRFLVSLGNTFVYAFVGAFFKVVIGLALAMLLNQDFKGRGLARTLLMLPWIVPVTASITSWRWMFDGMYGVVNVLMLRLGWIEQPINFLGTKGVAMVSVLAVGIWMGYPQMMMMLLAGLQAITKEQYEAALVEGATSMQTFFKITLPALSGVMRMAIILSLIWTFNAFNVVWLLTRGGPSSSTHIMNTLAYEFSFINMRYDRGAAMSVIILAILAVLLYVHTRMTRQEEA